MLRSVGGMTALGGDCWTLFWICTGGFFFGGIVMRRVLDTERFVSLWKISFAQL